MGSCISNFRLRLITYCQIVETSGSVSAIVDRRVNDSVVAFREASHVDDVLTTGDNSIEILGCLVYFCNIIVGGSNNRYIFLVGRSCYVSCVRCSEKLDSVAALNREV